MDPDLSAEAPADAPPAPDVGPVPDDAPGGPLTSPPSPDDASVDDLIAEFQRDNPAEALAGDPAEAPTETSAGPAAVDIDALSADSAPGDVAARLDGVLGWIRNQEAGKIADAVRADTEASIKFAADIVGDAPGGENAVRGLLLDKHNREIAFRHAFTNRYAAPGMWRQALKTAAREIRSELAAPRIDEKATRDREAVTLAVRGQRGPAVHDDGDDIDEAKVAKMTDAEYEAWKGDLVRERKGTK